MRPYLKRVAIIGGFIAFATPILMLFLWNQYINEQAQLTQEREAARQKCEPYELQIDRSSERLSITWETDGECSGFVLLATTFADFSNLPYKVLSSEGEMPGINHSIQLLKQDELEYRYAIVVSDGEWYGIRGEPFLIKD